jgi:hypothetical protein
VLLLLEKDGSIRIYTYHFGKALLSFEALLEEAQTQVKKSGRYYKHTCESSHGAARVSTG